MGGVESIPSTTFFRSIPHGIQEVYSGSRFVRIERFIEPTECLPVEKISEGDRWTYELKLHG